MTLILQGKREEIPLEKPMRIKALLKQLDIYPEEVLVVVNDKLSTEDRYIKPGDVVEVIRVISSG